MASVIDINSVDFAYGPLPVLSAIDLQVNEGDFLGIVGPNAGGKSTLLKLIMGLLEPQRGSVKLFGKHPDDKRQLIGYVAQYPSFPRDFPISVEQVVLLGRLGLRHGFGRFGGLWPGRFSPQDHIAARQALAEVEADNIINRQIGSLSGGQLQRVLLARALVGNPQILILDEPTANIDQRLEGEIFDLLKDLNERMTILVVSHDVSFVSSYVNQVACVNQTLVCHQTSDIDSQVIQDLYGEHVSMVHHGHSHG